MFPTPNSENEKRLRFSTAQPVSIAADRLIETGYLEESPALPLKISPAVENLDLVAWAKNNRVFLDEELTKHGAILFRKFDIKSVEEFEQFVSATSNKSVPYNERSSPRSRVRGNIYTSTDYPADQRISFHNENSYQNTFPSKLFFFCITPAEQGGETPIADCRRVLERISPKILRRFSGKGGWMLVRNFAADLGLSWQTAFQTTRQSEVEEYCRRAGILTEWRGDRLRTRQVRPLVQIHPVSGARSWFNHLTFFHVSTLGPAVAAALMSQCSQENLPANTYYGDGSNIEAAVLEDLREAYQQESKSFRWRRGDLLLLDNILTAHSREPFLGPRQIVVGMSDPITRES